MPLTAAPVRAGTGNHSVTAGEFSPDLRPLWTDHGPALSDDGTQRMAPYPTRHQIPVMLDRSDRAWFTVSKGWSDESVSYRVWLIGTTGILPMYLLDEAGVLAQDGRRRWLLPDGTDKITVDLGPHSDPIGWSLRVLRA